MAARGRDSESGQVIVIMAVVVSFVLLGVAAIAIDLGNGELQKRRLQNVADAAALAAANVMLQTVFTQADARSAAQTAARSYLGAGFNFPVSNSGSGTTLTDGIEFSTYGVRVALKKTDVTTLFASVFGIHHLSVSARARATLSSEGVLPIAIKRWSAGDTARPLGSTNGNPNTVSDYLLWRDHDTINQWPSPLTSKGIWTADSSAAVWASSSPDHPGRMMPILGQGAVANVANSNDFHFWVAPDVRDITFTPPTFVPPVVAGTSVQQLKDVESQLFSGTGLRSNPPYVGQQLATLNGTDTSKAVDAMRAAFPAPPAKQFVAMVYDGTVYRKPEFTLSATPAVYSDTDSTASVPVGTGGPPSDPPASPISFNVTLQQLNNFNSGGVSISAVGLLGWARWRCRDLTGGGSWGSTDGPCSVSVAATNKTIEFQVWADSAGTRGARTVVIEGWDAGTGIFRTTTKTLVIGPDEAFSVSTGEGFKSVEQGSTSRFDLDVEGWNGIGTHNVTVNGLVWKDLGGNVVDPGAKGLHASYPGSVQVKDNHVDGLRIDVSADAGAEVGTWKITVPFDDPDVPGSPDQQIYLTLQTTGTGNTNDVVNTASYVTVLGYAAFVVDHYDTNTAFGYAVSGLESHPSLLGRGQVARLVGWSQP